jgi:WD40 repeat protein
MDDDIAVLVLSGHVPSGVNPAKLEFPYPGDLVGCRWWAFGFPASHRRGNTADGVIGAALTMGWVRLDVESRYPVEPGFSGSGLWSPDYQAVVAIVGEVNERGDGQAITLHQADAALPKETLRHQTVSRSSTPESSASSTAIERRAEDTNENHGTLETSAVTSWIPLTTTATIQGQIGGIRSVAFSHDGRILATEGAANTIQLWDSNSGKHQRTLEGHTGQVNAMTFSPVEDLLATAAEDRSIRLWDPLTGREKSKLVGHSGVVYALAFSPDGRTLASSSSDRTARIWDLTSGNTLHVLTGHAGAVCAIAFSADGAQLATGDSNPSFRQVVARTWDSTTGRYLAQFPADFIAINTIAFSPTGKLLVVGGERWGLRFWDTTSLRFLGALGGTQTTRIAKWTMAPSYPYSKITAAAFSPDGNLLAITNGLQWASLHDPVTGKKLGELKGHTAEVRNVAFSPAGRLLATAGKDARVQLWR